MIIWCCSAPRTISTRRAQKIALLADTSGFGQGATEQLKIVAKERNLDAIFESFAPSDTDLIPQLSRIRDAGAQVILCWTVRPPAWCFLKQAQQLGLDESSRSFTATALATGKYMELAGSAAAKLLLLSQKFVVGDQLPELHDPVKPKIAALTESFKRRFNRTPNQFVAQTYDAVYLAKIALSNGGSDREKVREAFENIRDYQCASVSFRSRPEHHSGLAKQYRACQLGEWPVQSRIMCERFVRFRATQANKLNHLGRDSAGSAGATALRLFLQASAMAPSTRSLLWGSTSSSRAQGALNFAQGEWVMLGGMIAAAVVASHAAIWAGCLVAVVIVAAVGFVVGTIDPWRRSSVQPQC
jgi:hypothetical protein